MTRPNDGDELQPTTLAELVGADAVLWSADETFDVDTSTGKAVFRG